MSSSRSPVSTSDGIVDANVERAAEIELHARREESVQRISRSVAWLSVVMVIALAGMWLLVAPYTQLLLYAVLILLVALGAGLYPALRQRNRMTTGLFVLYVPALALVLFSPLLIPSLMPVMGLTNIIIMITIMLLDDRGSRWLMGVLVLAYLADVIVVSVLGSSLFPPLERSTELWVTGVVSLTGILTAILIIHWIVSGLEQQSRQMQGLNRELERRMQALNETQIALQDERNLLRTLIDTVPAYVYIKDTHSRFVNANLTTALAMGAKTPNDLIGKTDSGFFTAELAAKDFADEQAVLQSGQRLLNIEELTVDQRTGQNLWLLTTKVPIRNQRGEITGLVGISLDITERKMSEARQANLMREQERATIFNEYIADISHDFRTPLTIIQTSIELLKRYTDPEKQERHYTKIKTMTDRIESLLEEITALSRLDREPTKIDYSQLDLNSVLKTVLSEIMSLALQKNQQVDLRLSEDIPLVQANQVQLTRVMKQLFLNAITFTGENGVITIKTFTKADKVIFEVQDNGSGINPDDLGRIFDRLFRVDKARGTGNGGAGLGLTIVKKIVEAHGGAISVESQVNVGTTFTVSLPLHQTPETNS